jgi:hypothetical protein
MFQMHPREPQAIYCNGTVVGFKHARRGRDPEYVAAAGRDPEIQRRLDEWFSGYQREQQAVLAAASAKFWGEQAMKERQRVEAARRAVGLDTASK